VFGRDGPLVPLDVAVRASAAIPGLFAPQWIEGRRHVDGGVWSATNVDLLAGLDLDLVLVLSPLSGGHLPLARCTGPWWQKVSVRLARGLRRRVDGRLETELQRVQASGTPVLVLHPGADEIAAMPFHCMSLGQRGEVMRRATARTLGLLQHDPRWRSVGSLLEQAIWPREAWLRSA
jgi:NTE family protein